VYLLLFIKGIAAGLVIAAPVGPVGVLCVHRTLVWGRIHGLLSGLGAAVADAAFGAMAALGFTVVAAFLVEHHHWLQLGGGILLLALGAKTLLVPMPEAHPEDGAKSLLGDSLSTFVLTATNPITLLSLLGAFAALGITTTGAPLVEGVLLVVGVFLGSALWWFLLAAGVGLFRPVMEALYLRWIHHISGTLIIAVGVGVLASLAM
jgi:threonine/homoserine/homoserine lactone efflux protein